MQPRSREERHYFKYRENVEKERLKNRTGNYFRYEEIQDPLIPESNAPAYINEKDRMIAGGADMCEKDLFEREADLERRNAILEARLE